MSSSSSDDAQRVQEIRARHVAAGDPGDPYCAECSDASYPIWPCDVADLLAVIDAQRAIMNAQASVSEQHRKRVQELANDLEHALATVGAFRQAIENVFAKADEHEIDQDGMIVTYVLPCGPLHRAIGMARGTDAGGRLLAELARVEAERDAARAWSVRWKAVAKRLWGGIHKSLDQSERLAARMLKAEAERDALAARLAAAEAALKGVCEKLVQPGEEFFSEHTEKGWREFLLTHRREIGRPLNSRDSVLARMAYLSGFMGGAQSGAYLLYVHHLTRAGSREQAKTTEGE